MNSRWILIQNSERGILDIKKPHYKRGLFVQTVNQPQRGCKTLYIIFLDLKSERRNISKNDSWNRIYKRAIRNKWWNLSFF